MSNNTPTGTPAAPGAEQSPALDPEPIEVWRGVHGDVEPLFGPLPALRLGDVLAYEWALPERFIPSPGRMAIERTFVLLDVGVSFANPFWFSGAEVDTWYVDLVSVEQQEGRYLHSERWPAGAWTDFPPQAIRRLREIVGPFGPTVRAGE